ncbi:MAG: NAD-dependent DNA ligase LigA [Peptoniphilaceae bacterium]|nr:NAD-dependent DNA ligase LigA [Peptoniphilaceae bacterium]MDD7383862.1 NAD-dependent DNA ligase LigA [Peptoniphilaceae bacterium]MDY3738003.1 NAD-dependent DNA ligase LigA [Peptoniphilaceae bacterium]
MNKKEIINELIKQINDLNYYYYTLDNPKVSDGEYDKIYKKLSDLEKETGYIREDSPTQRVGGEILEKFQKHYHINRLYSLDKSQSYDEIKLWIERAEKLRSNYNQNHEEKLPKLEYICEYKFDGLTINLTYENKVLKYASTRGNGIVGEEIKPQILTIPSIPLSISEEGTFEIQGEGLMPLSSLEKYNETAEVKLKNARNAAAGALRNLDTSITAKRHLTAYFYNIPTSPINFKSEEEMLNFLKKQRIKVYPEYEKVQTYEQIIEVLEKIKTKRKEIDILTDGVVIKINDKKTQEVLGFTNKFPRRAIAFKFDPDEYTTILREVTRNVGRSGKVTPTAIVDPVDFGTVTVKRATLNNYDDIKRKKLKLNSTVFIRRSNDVIPEILGVVDENEEGTKEIEKPKYCPYCGTKLIEGDVHIFCPNSISCKPQLVARMVHFASRNCMNIDGFSEKTITKLMKELDLSEIYDIYDLKYEDLIKLEGFKDKKTKNLLESIEKSKNVNLENFINALGIPNVGEKTARDLANNFKTFEKLRKSSIDDLIKINDIGEIVAKSIVDFFNDERIKNSINEILKRDIKINEVKESFSNELNEKKYVITGTISDYTRDEIKELILKNGGKVSTSVSKNTDFLLAGEKAGSKKNKAEELGVEILENEDLFNFLEKLKK